MKLLLPLALVFLTGCQSVNWNQRIGAYTYNDALTEHGVPAKSVNKPLLMMMSTVSKAAHS